MFALKGILRIRTERLVSILTSASIFSFMAPVMLMLNVSMSKEASNVSVGLVSFKAGILALKLMSVRVPSVTQLKADFRNVMRELVLRRKPVQFTTFQTMIARLVTPH